MENYKTTLNNLTQLRYIEKGEKREISKNKKKCIKIYKYIHENN